MFLLTFSLWLALKKNARKQSSKWQNFKMDVGENWNITKS